MNKSQDVLIKNTTEKIKNHAVGKSNLKVAMVGCLNLDLLAMAKEGISRKDPTLLPAFNKLRSDAVSAVNDGPFSVMDKTKAPVSGDKHDYSSQARYWWPDPSKPNGLPYICRDGQFNPEADSDAFDRINVRKMSVRVQTLILDWYFSNDEKSGKAAAHLLRTWFLNESTRMNPSLEFAQGVPGKSTGRCYGLIDLAILFHVLPLLPILEKCKDWTAQDREGMKTWFSQYIIWFLQSKAGKEEAAAKNNHGTWYDSQMALFGHFLERKEIVLQAAENAKHRVDTQIESDGKQTYEAARTRSFFYSVYNLTALFNLARIAESVGVDLWNYQSPTQGGILQALKYIAPYLDLNKKWPWQEIESDSDRFALYALVWQGNQIYLHEGFDEFLKLQPGAIDHQIRLLFPK